MKYIKLKIVEYLLENQINIFGDMQAEEGEINYKNVQREYKKKHVNLSDDKIFSETITINNAWYKAENKFYNPKSVDDFVNLIYNFSDNSFNKDIVILYINGIEDLKTHLTRYLRLDYKYTKMGLIENSIDDHIYKILDENDIEYDKEDEEDVANIFIDYVISIESDDLYDLIEYLFANLYDFEIVLLYNNNFWKDVCDYDENIQKIYDIITDENDVDSERIKLYRALDIPKNDRDMIEHIKHYDKVGVYWGGDIEHAIVYWGHVSNKHNIVLEAEVDVINVDFEYTINLNISDLADEREIRLYADKPVKITKIHFTDMNFLTAEDYIKTAEKIMVLNDKQKELIIKNYQPKNYIDTEIVIYS